MSEQKELESLMTEQDALIVARITGADAPHGQRAQALLAVHEGKTQEEAAEASGLRPTQVQYWVTRFGKSGLAIFPEDLLVEEVEEVVAVEEVEEMVAETAVSPEEPALEQTPFPQKEEEKKKKAKSAKDAKKSKKDKKSRKKKKDAKKDKKSKKKKGKKKADKSKKAKKLKKKKKAKSKKK